MSSTHISSIKVGFIGLGIMGGAMAGRLLAAGYAVAGCDVNPVAGERLRARGGSVVPSPREAARDAEALVLMVRDAGQARDALLGAHGACESMAAGTPVWLASTVAPADVLALGAELSARGLALVDGPVSGGATGAEAGSLTIMAGGERAAFESLRPLMLACGKTVFHTGGLGSGSGIKLINQLLTASHIALTAEALALCQRLGIDPALMIEVVTQSAGNSFQFQKRAPRMAARDHARQSTLNIFLKDLRIALDCAEAAGSPAPLAQGAHAMFALAAALGSGEDSDTLITRAYQAGNPTPTASQHT